MNPEDGMGVAEFSEERIKNDVLEAKKLFERAVFSSSASLPAEAEPSREVQSREAELRYIIRAFFEFLERVCSGNVEIVASRIKDEKNEGRTYSKATLELRSDRNVVPPYQVWVTEVGLKYIDRERDPEAWSNRIDNRLRSERDKVLNEWLRLAELNTERAAIKKSQVLRTLVNISRVPIESWQIQFQRYKGMRGGRHQITPLIGIRLVRYLDGYQAYPVIFVGRRGVVAFDMPLLKGEPSPPAEIKSYFGENFDLPFIDEEEAKKSPFYKIFSVVLTKAFPQHNEVKASN